MPSRSPNVSNDASDASPHTCARLALVCRRSCSRMAGRPECWASAWKWRVAYSGRALCQDTDPRARSNNPPTPENPAPYTSTGSPAPVCADVAERPHNSHPATTMSRRLITVTPLAPIGAKAAYRGHDRTKPSLFIGCQSHRRRSKCQRSVDDATDGGGTTVGGYEHLNDPL